MSQKDPGQAAHVYRSADYQCVRRSRLRYAAFYRKSAQILPVRVCRIRLCVPANQAASNGSSIKDATMLEKARSDAGLRGRSCSSWEGDRLSSLACTRRLPDRDPAIADGMVDVGTTIGSRFRCHVPIICTHGRRGG